MGCETNVQYAVPWRFLSDSEWEHDKQPHILFSVRRRPLSCSSEHKRRSCWCYQFPQRTFSLWALCESTVNDRIPHICLLDVLWDCWCFYLPSGPGCRVRKSAFPSSALQRKTWRYHKSWWWTNASRFLSADNQTFVVWNWIHFLFFTVSWLLGWEMVLCAYILIRVADPLWGRKQCLCWPDSVTTI